ncbi:MAG TPA: PEP-CTERM sorting domain-containing protein [Oceanipulchritudo sp.]|nr:PEP-CTERM sorting domain-containing protein [Oceanipulchritudo sp.]
MNKLFLTVIGFLGVYTAHAQTTLISENFEGYTADQMLSENFAKYDHTKGGAFSIGDTAPNILGFYAGGSTDWIVKVDPLNASNLTLWGNGGDTQSNPGRGIYMMRLDPTGGGAIASGAVQFDYSFRMLRANGNAAAPSAFEIKFVTRPDAPDENLDMYEWVGEITLDSFASSTTEWVTVSGSYTADLATLDQGVPYETGIRIDPTDGAWVGGGTGGFYYVDDFTLTVTAVPEPATFALLGGMGALGMVLYRRRMKQSA